MYFNSVVHQNITSIKALFAVLAMETLNFDMGSLHVPIFVTDCFECFAAFFTRMLFHALGIVQCELSFIAESRAAIRTNSFNFEILMGLEVGLARKGFLTFITLEMF
jgi:hypothetical protein